MFSFFHHNAHQNANGAHHNVGCVNLASLIHLLSRVQELNPWETSNNLTQAFANFVPWKKLLPYQELFCDKPSWGAGLVIISCYKQ
jgi:hypothetical protein